MTPETRLPTEIRLQWVGTGNMPTTLLTVRHGRVLTAEEVRMLADIVEHVEDMRELVKEASP